MRRHLTLLAAAGALLGLTAVDAANTAEAQQISPLRHVISASAAEAASYTVVNPESAPMPIQVKVVRRVGDEPDQVEPAPDDFLIFPPQALIQPGKSQVFRAQYKGSGVASDLDRYFIVFTKVPVAVSGSGGGVGLNFAYNIYLDVKP